MICLSAKIHGKEGYDDALMDRLFSAEERRRLEPFVEAADSITRQHGVPLSEITVLEDYYGKNYLAVTRLKKADHDEMEDIVEQYTGCRPPSLCPPEEGASLSASQSMIKLYRETSVRLIDGALHHEAGHLVGNDGEVTNGLYVMRRYLENVIFWARMAKTDNAVELTCYMTALKEKFGSCEHFREEIQSLENELALRFEQLQSYYEIAPQCLPDECDYGSAKLKKLESIVSLSRETQNRIGKLWIGEFDSGWTEEGGRKNGPKKPEKVDLVDAAILRAAVERDARHTIFERAFATSRELAADRFAAVHAGPDIMIAALKELGSWEIADKKWNDDFDPHPPISERVRAIKKFARQAAL